MTKSAQEKKEYFKQYYQRNKEKMKKYQIEYYNKNNNKSFTPIIISRKPVIISFD